MDIRCLKRDNVNGDTEPSAHGAGPCQPDSLRLMKTIVAALDFSDATPRVLDQAVGLAHAFGAELHLLHTVDPGPDYAIYGFGPAELPDADITERAREASDKRLADLAAAAGLDEAKVHTATLSAMPVEGILGYARDHAADLIVLGAHGHGVLTSMFVGSVAQGVVRHAEFPTLVVPGTC